MSDRFILKQFAGNATNDDVHGTGVFGSCSAGSPTLTTDFKQVQSLQAYEDGWSAATMTNDKLPPANEMQGLQGLLCKAIKEIYSEGIPEWIDGETYYQGSYVQYNGVVYRNITGSYTSTAPDSDTTNWQNEFARLNTDNVFTQSQYINSSTEKQIIFKAQELATNNTTPINNVARNIRLVADNNELVGMVQFISIDNGRSYAGLQARRTIGGINYNSSLSVQVDNNGESYAFAPTPADYDKSSKIATTAWTFKNAPMSMRIATSHIVSTTLTNNDTYEAPLDGYICVRGGTNTTRGTVRIDSQDTNCHFGWFSTGVDYSAYVYIGKGEILSIYYHSGNSVSVTFLPVEGNY